MNDSLLLMSGIGKAFPGVRALDGVDFRLRRGEVHILLGENGAGKSTLMKILGGAYRLDEGRIEVEGTARAIHNPLDAQRLGISVIYQELNLVPHLSVSENVFLGREPVRGMGVLDRPVARRKTAELLSQLGIPLDPSAKVGGLGIAQRQMVEVAKALSLDARILVMDEPTSALTTGEIQRLFALVRALRQRGLGIVYISHRLEEIFQIGDRVTVLRDGRSVATRDLQDVTVDELVRLMANRELKDHFPRRSVPVGGETLLQTTRLCTRGKLNNVNLTLHAGEIVGVAGLMGSGRSALARALFGVDSVSGGSIVVRQQSRGASSPRAAIRQGIGLLTEDRQHLGLVLGLSVRRNISLTSPRGVFPFGLLRPARERAIAAAYVSQLRIKTPHVDQPVAFLSGGNQQKVVLSKWLACQASILIFDEPTRGIDVAARFDIYELMNRLTEQGVAILMISSDLPEVLGMSDRILVMHRGEVRAEFSRAEATAEKLLKAALGDPA